MDWTLDSGISTLDLKSEFWTLDFEVSTGHGSPVCAPRSCARQAALLQSASWLRNDDGLGDLALSSVVDASLDGNNN